MLSLNRTSDDCRREGGNSSHTVCRCRDLSAYALAFTDDNGGGNAAFGGVIGGEATSVAAGGGGDLSGLALALLVTGLSLAVVAILLAAALCYICLRTRVSISRKILCGMGEQSLIWIHVLMQHAQHKPLKDDPSFPGFFCFRFCGGGDSSREGTHSPDFSFQGQVVHQDSPTFTRTYQDMVSNNDIHCL